MGSEFYVVCQLQLLAAASSERLGLTGRECRDQQCLRGPVGPREGAMCEVLAMSR